MAVPQDFTGLTASIEGKDPTLPTGGRGLAAVLWPLTSAVPSPWLTMDSVPSV